MRRWIWFMLVASVLLTGCISGAKPKIEVRSGDVIIPAIVSTNCWSRCEDYPTPPEQLRNHEPQRVQPGALILINLSPAPSKGTLEVVEWVDDKRTPVPLTEDGSFLANLDPGVYIFDVTARWGDRGMTWAFAVQVEEP